MEITNFRLWLFRIITAFIVIIAIECSGYIAMCINSGSFDWLNNKNYFRVRAMLIGNAQGEEAPRYLTLPYLGYIPYPGYIKYGVVQHNNAGYRGAKVPLLKTCKLRVLCMGGSTTYGLGVEKPSETYPAQLEILLNNYISKDSILSKKYCAAEVLNAGLEAGTSAEELQQYLFKYRYYMPDVVIIHSGINDAEVMGNTTDFQLDYTNYRRLQFHLEPLPVPARWLMRSYFISYIVIRLFYEDFYYSGQNGRECYSRQKGQKFCNWTDINMDSIFKNNKYQYIPFYRNTKTLYEEIAKDSATLIMLPCILNKKDSFVRANPGYRQKCDQNEAISQMLIDRIGGFNIAFTFDSIRDPHCWIDDCHLNAAGEANKAQIALPYVIKAVKKKLTVV
jgi:lysophospholipase L1-like esterase